MLYYATRSPPAAEPSSLETTNRLFLKKNRTTPLAVISACIHKSNNHFSLPFLAASLQNCLQTAGCLQRNISKYSTEVKNRWIWGSWRNSGTAAKCDGCISSYFFPDLCSSRRQFDSGPVGLTRE